MDSTARAAFAVEADLVERRIEGALRGDGRWSVTRFEVLAIRDDERALAARLAQVARD